MSMILWLLKNYNILLDDNATDGLDTQLIQSGYLFDKKLSDENKELIDTLNNERIDKLVTLFNEDDTLLDKITKTILEYTFYQIPAITEEFSTVRQVVEDVKLIKVLDKKEFIEFCNDLVRLDKALESSILEELFTYLTVDVSEIKNKEIKILYIKDRLKNNKFVNGYELIRYINYLLTGNTLFINFRKKYANKNMRFDYVDTYDKLKEIYDIFSKNEIELSKYYNLYRDFFIHIKLWAKRNLEYYHLIENFNDSQNKRIEINQIFSLLKNSINRITRFSKKNKQIKINLSFDKDIINESFEKQEEFYRSKTLKELFKLLNYFTVEKYYVDKGLKSYKIRNGKNYIKEYKGKDIDVNSYLPLYKIIKEKILASLKEIKTEKDFMGNEYTKEVINDLILPKLFTTPLLLSDKKRSNGMYYKSSVDLQENDRIGIIWDYDVDLDLSLLLTNGDILSWNNDFKSGKLGLEFSGDKRSAGSEYVKFKNLKNVKGYLRSNFYSGDMEDVKFNIFIERDGKIIYKSDNISFKELGKSQLTIGYVNDNKFFLDIFPEKDSSVAYYKKDSFDNENFFIDIPVPTVEKLLDYLEIPYKKLDTTELKNKEYYIFE
nr:MAG TPA: hypothetical protein [Herelleviridae sp.]